MLCLFTKTGHCTGDHVSFLRQAYLISRAAIKLHNSKEEVELHANGGVMLQSLHFKRCGLSNQRCSGFVMTQKICLHLFSNEFTKSADYG